METQVQNSKVLLTKATLPIESPSTAIPTILIESILPSRTNPDFQGVMLRWKTERTGQTASSLVSFALGGATEENRVAVQTFKKDVIAKFKIEEGKNLNDILKEAGMEPARLTVSEITESEYEGLTSIEQAGYSAKVNPNTGEMLQKNGEQIYRRVFFDSISGTDRYVQHNASQAGENPVV
jgi:hypothetical protein